MASHSRHIFLVDPALQFRFGITLGIAGVVATLLCAGALHEVTLIGRQTLPVSAAVSAELERQDGVLWSAAGWLSLAVGVVWTIAGTFLSHRLAGPVFAMSRYAATLAKGRYPSTRPLRDGDELKDLYNVFAKSIESLRAQQVDDLHRLEEVIHALNEAPSAAQLAEPVATLTAMARQKQEATQQAAWPTSPGGRS